MAFRVKRKLGLVLTNVRSAGAHGHYYVGALIDGAERSALFVVDERSNAIEPQDGEFESYLDRYVESRFLPKILLSVHRGEKLDFPMNLRSAGLEHLRQLREELSRDDE